MEHDYDDDALDSPHPIPQSINILFSYSMTQRNLKIVPLITHPYLKDSFSNNFLTSSFNRRTCN